MKLMALFARADPTQALRRLDVRRRVVDAALFVIRRCALWRPSRIALAVAVALIGALLPIAPVAADPQPPEQPPVGATYRVSVTSGGGQANAASRGPIISEDGRYVLFSSDATNLVAGDTNGNSDVFIRDRTTGINERISVSTSGGQAIGSSYLVGASSDARYVVFYSSGVVSADANFYYDVFLRDRIAGTTTWISVDSNEVPGNRDSTGAAVSNDGRFVAFDSDASNLVGGDSNGTISDVFLRDVTAGTTTLLSKSTGGASGNGHSWGPEISSDGTKVAFFSYSTNFGSVNGFGDVFVRDRSANTTTRVSVSSSGSPGNEKSQRPRITADGRYVVFESKASNLVSGDTNGAYDVFRHDRLTGSTTRVSLSSNGGQVSHGGAPNLSPDGRFIVFFSSAAISAADTNNFIDVYVRDIANSTTTMVSVSANAAAAYDYSDVSGDGRYVVWDSTATNLVGGDTNNVNDVFLRDRIAPPVGGAVGAAETFGAGACGAPAVHEHATSKPVDTATGNFWHTFHDVSIASRGPGLSLSRTYNSLDLENVGWFGPGWTSSYETSINVSGATATVKRANGSRVTFTLSGGNWNAPPRSDSVLTSNGDGTWTFVCNAKDSLTFDASGRLTALTDLNGYSTTLTYPSSTQVVATDSSGRTLTFAFVSGRLVSVTDSASPPRSVTYSYDAAGDLTDVVDVGGGHSQFTYDLSHRLLTMRSPKFYGDATTSPSPVTTNHYDTGGKIDWQSDELGRTTLFDYTTLPGSTLVTDPKGNVTRYEYEFGVLISETRGYGTAVAAEWKYEFDPVSTARTLTVDPLGHEWRAVYDSSGNALFVTDPNGRTTSATYNSLGLPLTITTPDDVTTTMTYDAAGNPQTRSTPWLEGPPSTNRLVSYHHDDAVHPGDVTSVTDPLGKVWLYAYDDDGNLSTSTDPLGETTTYCYDAIGRRVARISPRGAAAGVNCATTAPAPHTSYFTFNAYGDLLTATDPLGNVTTNVYDADRRPAASIDPTQKSSAFSFDPAGQLIETTRADNSTVRTEYWPDGTVKYQYNGANHRTAFAYDAQGRLTSSTDPLGRTTALAYDLSGNVVSKQAPGGNCQAQPRVSCTTFTYDSANQQTGVDYSDPATPDVSVAYDGLGRRTSVTDGMGITTYTWDSLGRMTSSASPGGTVQYGYDLRGAETATTYPSGLGTVTRTYDDVGRLKTVTDWLSNETSYNYDADSNRTTQVNPNGTTATLSVDDNGAVADINHAPTANPSSSFASFSYDRDDEGKFTSLAASGVPTDNHMWGYTDIDQLITDTAAAFPYSYDTAENLTALASGRVQSFDNANQLTSTSDPISLVGTGGAAGTDLIADVGLPGGIAANDQIILSATIPANQLAIAPVGYTAVGSWKSGDDASNTKLMIFRKTAEGGETSATIVLSGLGAHTVNAAVYRGVDIASPIDSSTYATSSSNTVVVPSLTTSVAGTQLVGFFGATQAGTASASWSAPTGMVERDERSVASADGAIADQWLTAAGPTGTRTAVYGSTGELVGVTVALRAKSTTYTHDTRGNRTGRSGPVGGRAYGYDEANRMVSHTNGAATTTYAYNADGLRMNRGGSSPTSFKWAVNAGLPRLLVDGTTAYVYGAGAAPISKIDGSVILAYHHDALGSVRAVSNGSGQVVATYSYDAYGNPAGTTGSITNPFRYAGEYLDAESSLIYLRARHYDPATGQFLTRDPLEPVTGSPYGYVGGDPLNYTDPSGLLGVRLGPVKVGNDGCVFGANPDGSCRGSGALPDYVAVDVSGYIPMTPIGAGLGGGGSITVTRSGQVYVGVHGGVGIGAGGSVRGGYMLPEYEGQGRASDCRIDGFVKGFSGSLSADTPASQAITANGSGVAAEMGVATGPGTSLTIGHNWAVADLGDGW